MSKVNEWVFVVVSDYLMLWWVVLGQYLQIMGMRFWWIGILEISLWTDPAFYCDVVCRERKIINDSVFAKAIVLPQPSIPCEKKNAIVLG